jgi:hypothetical protein
MPLRENSLRKYLHELEHMVGLQVRTHSEDPMNSVIYLIGFVVAVLLILSFLGMT